MQVIEAKGFKLPLVGLGTWTLRGRDCARLVEQAIRVGYRHIDTAQMYDNEREVGEGVRASGRRDEVMVITKVQPTLLAPHDLERSVKESLARLRLDVIDLLADPLAQSARAAGGDARRHGQDETRGLYAGTSACRTSPWRCSTRPSRSSPEPLVCNQIECHPVSRPGQGDRGLPQARHGGGRLQPDRARAGAGATSCSPVSARRMARPRRKSACAGSSSRASW